MVCRALAALHNQWLTYGDLTGSFIRTNSIHSFLTYGRGRSGILPFAFCAARVGLSFALSTLFSGEADGVGAVAGRAAPERVRGLLGCAGTDVGAGTGAVRGLRVRAAPAGGGADSVGLAGAAAATTADEVGGILMVGRGLATALAPDAPGAGATGSG